MRSVSHKSATVFVSGLMLSMSIVMPAQSNTEASRKQAEVEQKAERILHDDTYSLSAVADIKSDSLREEIHRQLTKRFEVQEEGRELIRIRAAAALVRINDKAPQYWNYLFAAASEIVNSSIPSPIEPGKDGSLALSPDFRRQAVSAHVDPEQAAQKAIYVDPTILGLVADTKDVRVLPLLRKGLESRNYMVQLMAARYIANFQDEDSVHSLVAAVQNSPEAIAPLLAECLLYFKNDRLAEAMAERYLPEEHVKAIKQAIENGHGPLN